MEAEIMIGKYSGSFLLTVLLAWVFTMLAKDPDALSNRVKKGIAVAAGVVLSWLSLIYQASIPGTEISVNIITGVDFSISGFLMGTSAIGINQLMKSETKALPSNVTTAEKPKEA